MPGFPAAEIIYKDERVAGVITGDMVDQDGNKKDSYQPMEILANEAKFLLKVAEGLGKQLIKIQSG